MEAFATVEDYEARYGPVDDEQRLGTLLADASAFVAAQPGFSADPDDDVQSANLVRVTCSVVHRTLMSGDASGVSSYSQGAAGISASVTFYNPAGDFYLTSAEKKSIGIGAGRMGQTWPYSCDGRPA